MPNPYSTVTIDTNANLSNCTLIKKRYDDSDFFTKAIPSHNLDAVYKSMSSPYDTSYNVHNFHTLNKLWRPSKITNEAWRQVEMAPKPCDSADVIDYFADLDELCEGYRPVYVDLKTLPKRGSHFKGPELCESDIFLAQYKMSQKDCLSRQGNPALTSMGFFAKKPNSPVMTNNTANNLLEGTLNTFSELDLVVQTNIVLATITLGILATRCLFSPQASKPKF